MFCSVLMGVFSSLLQRFLKAEDLSQLKTVPEGRLLSDQVALAIGECLVPMAG